MKRKLEISELIFKILAYTFLTVFALLCLYPFLYAVSASISGRHAVEYQELILFPKDVQFEAFANMFSNNLFWNATSSRGIMLSNLTDSYWGPRYYTARRILTGNDRSR